ncbi:FACT complex subunit SSRP1-like isoform X2 [Chelonus insularis]|uniref:FACT complex subunit SSRP1-like isoform X2 n=1 Tax=Chelonus insularis TaxID=460826 RepID=UPI00158CD6E2|nr:FACT complex subunit SSRP1-like isoform X2 [Chelonus insularis]
MMGRRPRNHKLDSEDDSQQNDGSTSKNDEPRRNKKIKSNKITKGASGPTNPFLIFFLRMRSKRPNDRCTVIARTAGKLWKKMTPGQRQKYINLANAAKKKKELRKRKKEAKNIEQ